MRSVDEKRLDVLAREAGAVYEATRSLFVISERVIALGLTILGVSATAGVVQRAHVVLVVLPFGVLGVLAYGIHIATELFYLGSYRRYLEEQINSLLGAPVLMWESAVVPRLRRGLTGDGMMVATIILAVLAGSLALGWYQAGVELSPGWAWGTRLGLLGTLFVVVIGFLNMVRAPERGFQALQEVHSDES